MHLEPRVEQRLEQKLEQQVELRIELEQYLAQEDLIKGFIRWVEEHNSWVTFDSGGFRFRYGNLPYSVAEPIADRTGPGFAYCMYEPFEAVIQSEGVALAKGDWTLFVVGDMVPRDLVDFVAIHERGEELSWGNHYFASQLEFAFANKRHRLRRYVDFINRAHPSKFIDLTQEVMFPVLPDELIEYLEEQGLRNQGELRVAEALIEKYPLPRMVLRLMDKYEGATVRACDLINKLTGRVQAELRELKLTGRESYEEQVARVVNERLSETLISVYPSEARGISRVRVNDAMRFFSRDVLEWVPGNIQGRIYIPTDFPVAYKDAINGREIVKGGEAVEHKVIEDAAERV